MSRQVRGVSAACTLADAAASMARARISCLVVTDGNRPEGLITDADLVRLAHEKADRSAAVAEFMSRPVLTASPGTDFRSAYGLLRRHGIRHLVVVDAAGDIAGVVTLTDFLSHIGREFFYKVKSLRAVTDQVLAMLQPTASLATALQVMVSAKSDFVLVTEGECPVGILTERDVARFLTDCADPESLQLREVMSAPVHSISQAASVADAVNRLAFYNIRHLPVVDDANRILGVVNQARLLEKLGIELFDEAWRRNLDLSASKQRLEGDLQMVLEATGAGTWEFDHELNRHCWSSSVAAMLGCQHEQLPVTLEAWIARIHKEDLADFEREMAAVQGSDDQLVEAEYRIRKGDGTWLWVHERVRVLRRDAQRRPLLTVGTLTDISFRKQSDRLLAAERQNLRSLFETMDDYLFVIDHDGHIVHANRTVDQLGYGAALIGQSVLTVHPGESHGEVRRLIAEVIAGTRKHFPISLVKADGALVHVDTRAVCGEWNGVPAVFAVSRDISEQLQQREALLQGEALLRTTLDSTADGILVVTGTGRVLATNRRFMELWRVPQEIGESGEDGRLLAFVEGQLAEPDEFRGEVRRLSQTDEESSDTLEFSDGRVFQRYTRPIALPWEQARLWSFRDVTRETLAQGALEAERARLQTLIRAIPDPVWVKDTCGAYLACNPVFERLYGAREQEILGKTDFDFVDAKTARIFQQNDRAAMNAGGPLVNEEWLEFKCDGYLGLFETIKTPTFDANGVLIGVLGIARDVTAARLAREALREREEIFSAIVNQAADGVVLIDMETLAFAEFNEAACQGLGYTREEFARLTLRDLSAEEPPTRAPQRTGGSSSGISSHYETRYQRKNGTRADMRVSNRLIRIRGRSYSASIWQDITQQKRSARELQEAHMFLKETQSIARVGGWKANPSSDTVLWTEELFNLLERPPDKPPGCLEDMLRNYAPETLPEVKRQLLDSWETGLPFTMECGMISESGRRFIAELRCVGRVEEVSGSFLTGTFQDISDRKRVETTLRESEQRFRTLFDNATVAIFVHHGESGKMLQVNHKALEAFGYSSIDEINQADIWDSPPYSEQEALQLIRKCAEMGTQRFEWHGRARSGERFWMDVTLDRIDLDGERRVLAIAQDITERKNLEDELRLKERYHRAVLDNFPFPVWLKDRESRFLSVNQPFARFFGQASAESLVGKSDFDIASPEYAEMYRADDRAVLESGVPKNVEEPIYTEGRKTWNETYKSPVRMDGQIIGTVGYARDISARKQAEARVAFLAYHDPLTELPNRTLARDRAIQAMSLVDRFGGKLALLFLDIDNFKTINDSLGHPIGDDLLKEVAIRLCGCVRDTDTISRQGGDEFLILLAEVRDAEAIDRVLEKILARLAAPVVVEGHELSTSLSIGIAVYPDDGRDFDTLFQKADTAMYRAKEAGRNTYRFFTPQMNVEATEHLRVRNQLHQALPRGEFSLVYQPQIDLATDTVIGAEALLRWSNPELGEVPPSRFIAIAEDTGLIGPIGEWVLRQACCQAFAWQRVRGPALSVAVNLSAVQFRRGDLAATVTGALEESGLSPGLLELEITESLLLQQTDYVLNTVKRLKSLGVRLSIDDFGTGYSSLAYLKRFNVDKLKIDQSFVRDLVDDPVDAAIVSATIQMAHSLKLTTVAEGMETEGQRAFLREHLCDTAQGYFYAAPMPAAEFKVYLASRLTERSGV